MNSRQLIPMIFNLEHCILPLALSFYTAVTVSAERNPNMVVTLADDLGYSNVQV